MGTGNTKHGTGWRGASVLILLVTLVGGVSDFKQTLANEGEASETIIEAGANAHFSEPVVPDVLLLQGVGYEPRLTDTVSGRQVPLRHYREIVGRDLTEVALPQLPRGEFRLSMGAGEATLLVVDQRGMTFSLDSGENNRTGLWAVTVGAAAVGVAAGIVLKGRKRLLAILPLAVGIGALAWGGSAPAEPGQEACGVLYPLQQADFSRYLYRRDCEARNLYDMLVRGDTDSITEVLAKTESAGLCHDFAHIAGMEFVRRHEQPDAALSLAALPGCVDGVLHGAVAGLVLFESPATMVATIEALCAQLPTTALHRSCMHGLGHATLYHTNGDVPASWAICDTVTEYDRPEVFVTAIGRELHGSEYSFVDDCKQGAAMDWVNRALFHRRYPGAPLNPLLRNVEDLCPTGPATLHFQIGCYASGAGRDGDAQRLASHCAEKSTVPEACFMALASAVGTYVQRELNGMEDDTVRLALAERHLSYCGLADEGSARDSCAEVYYLHLTRLFGVTRVEAHCRDTLEEFRTLCMTAVAVRS